MNKYDSALQCSLTFHEQMFFDNDSLHLVIRELWPTELDILQDCPPQEKWQDQSFIQVPQNDNIYIQVTAPSSFPSNYDGTTGGHQLTL